MSYNFILPTVFALLFLSLSVSIQACKCAPPLSIPDAFRESDLIFLGNATSVTTSESDYENIISLDVLKCLKGNCNSTESVYTSASSASCGYIYFIPSESEEDPVGGLFLVYSSSDSGKNNVIGCSRTTKISSETYDLLLEIDALSQLAEPRQTLSYFY